MRELYRMNIGQSTLFLDLDGPALPSHTNWNSIGRTIHGR
jgi:hypothetical protein